MMKTVLTAATFWTLVLFSIPSWALTSMAMGPTKQSAFKSYKEWKTERIQDANFKILSTKAKIDLKKLDPNLAKTQGMQAGVPEVDRLIKQLKGEEMALELAQDLTVADYFVGYLTRLQDRKTAIQEVAGKMTPEEVAELMSAYAQTMSEVKTDSAPISADGHPIEQVK